MASASSVSSKPLAGVRVLEISGLAPAPFCGLVLADFGADVVRVDKMDGTGRPAPVADRLARGKRSVCLNLKSEQGKKVLVDLARSADVIIEPFRPGVMEKLGLGPEVLLAVNPKLIYARLTGWGQNGQKEVVESAGHDINYLSLSGMLSAIRHEGQRPLFPVNLLADFAGGGLMCALGIILALFQRQRTGKGQVVDAAMIDGVVYLSSFVFQMVSSGMWSNDLKKVGTNLLDSGAHFYDTYECKDGQYVAVGAIEPQFFRQLLQVMGFDAAQQKALMSSQLNRSKWRETREEFAKVFRTKTRDEWAALAHGKDACLTPVLSMAEAAVHPHNVARNTFGPLPESRDFPFQASAAPRLSSLQSVRMNEGRAVLQPGQHTVEVLKEFGFDDKTVAELLSKNGGYQIELKHEAKL